MSYSYVVPTNTYGAQISNRLPYKPAEASCQYFIDLRNEITWPNTLGNVAVANVVADYINAGSLGISSLGSNGTVAGFLISGGTDAVNYRISFVAPVINPSNVAVETYYVQVVLPVGYSTSAYDKLVLQGDITGIGLGVIQTSLSASAAANIANAVGNSITNVAYANSAGYANTALYYPVLSVNGQTGNVVVQAGNTIVTLVGDVSANGLTNSNIAVTLANTGVVAGTYGSSTQVAEHVVDAKGRILSASNVSISFPTSVSYANTSGVANVALSGWTYPVTSVNGMTGNVVISNVTNVSYANVAGYANSAGVANVALSGWTYPVTSVNGLTGNVVLTVNNIANAVSNSTLASYATQTYVGTYVAGQGFLTNVSNATVAVSNYANFAGSATISTYANSASAANVATTANVALSGWPVFSVNGMTGNVVISNVTSVNLANVANYANFAGSANISTYANSAGSANTATTANVALSGWTYPVTSVNGQTGGVVISNVAIANYANFTGSANTATTANVALSGWTYPVTSVNGQTGAVVISNVAIANYANYAGTATFSTYANSANTVNTITSSQITTGLGYVPLSNTSPYTLTGDVTGTGNSTNIVTTLATIGTLGTYSLASITVDAKGRVIAAANGTAGAGGTYVPVTGGTFTGQVTMNSNAVIQNTLTLTSATNTFSQIVLQNSGSTRWTIGLANTEHGSNSGSDLVFTAYADNGTSPLIAQYTFQRNNQWFNTGNSAQFQGSLQVEANGTSGGAGSTIQLLNNGNTGPANIQLSVSGFSGSTSVPSITSYKTTGASLGLPMWTINMGSYISSFSTLTNFQIGCVTANASTSFTYPLTIAPTGIATFANTVVVATPPQYDSGSNAVTAAWVNEQGFLASYNIWTGAGNLNPVNAQPAQASFLINSVGSYNASLVLNNQGSSFGNYGNNLIYGATGTSLSSTRPNWAISLGDTANRFNNNGQGFFYIARFTGTNQNAFNNMNLYSPPSAFADAPLLINIANGFVQLQNLTFFNNGINITGAAASTVRQITYSNSVSNFNLYNYNQSPSGGVGGSAPTNNRVTHGLTSTAETGNNVGSDFVITTWSDSGAVATNAVTIYRANANVVFANNVSTANAVIAGQGFVDASVTSQAVTTNGTFSIASTCRVALTTPITASNVALSIATPNTPAGTTSTLMIAAYGCTVTFNSSYSGPVIYGSSSGTITNFSGVTIGNGQYISLLYYGGYFICLSSPQS